MMRSWANALRLREAYVPGFTAPMKLCTFFMFLAALFSSSLHASGQVVLNEEKLSAPLQPGVVVEAIEKNSDGEKAGLREGDILLHWVRGEVSGEIEAPLTLFWINLEQSPRGAVTLEGLRSGERRVWMLGQRYLGITTRSNLPDFLLARYKEGNDLADRGKATEATERWRSVAAAVSNESLQASASLLFRTAELLSNTEQWKAADDAYQQALAMVSSSQHQNNKDFLLYAWAISFNQRGDLDSAEKYYQQAITESQKRGDENISAICLTNLGFVKIDRSELSKAENYLHQAVKISERIEPGSLVVASYMLNMGMIAIERGDLANAEEWEGRGLAILRKLAPRSNAVLVALNNLGEIARRRGDLERAEEFYREALTIKEKTSPDAPVVATFLQNLAIVADLRGDLGQAEEYLQRALAISKKQSTGNGQPDIARGSTVASMLKYLGDVAKHRGNYTKAEEFLFEALAIEEKAEPESLSIADVLNSLGDVSVRRSHLAEAKAYFSRALTIREKLAPGSTQHAETLAALASLAGRLQQPGTAEQLYRQALDALESQMARLGGAEETRSGFRAMQEGYYKEYIDLLMTRKQPELAFYTVERSHARTLLEMLAASHVDIRKGVDPALLEQERGLNDLLRSKINNRVRLLSRKHTEKQIETLDDEIAGLLHQHQEAEARIRANSPGYAALLQPQPLNAKAVQHLLPPNTLLLEYSLGESRSYVFAVTGNSLNGYELPGRVEIEGKSKHLYETLTERTRIVDGESDKQRRARLVKADREFRSAAPELSRTLLGPVAADLQQRKLLIVSDGALQYLPFAALLEPEALPAKTSRPLIVQHEIVNLPSASVLAFAPRKHLLNKEVAVFADPIFDRQDPRLRNARIKNVQAGDARFQLKIMQPIALADGSTPLPLAPTQLARDLARSATDTNLKHHGELHLPRLAFTRDEAKAILAVVPPGSSMEAVDFEASRKLAMSGELTRYRVVHFATHALVDDIHPQLSGLVLSLLDQKGEPTDGFLELQDIYNLELSADLVVLSACQTALGKEINGEGMIGLTRGFMYAGASGVVATLWKVNDFATAKLMARFYKAMERDGMKPAQALRQAQLSLWKDPAYTEPYYWAGFILQGGWQ